VLLAKSTVVKSLAITSGLCSAVVLPFTGLVILPTNRALITLDDKQEFSDPEEKRAKELIAKWDERHKLRYLMYGAAWISSLGALVSEFGASL
jgi:hypothetical protein